MRISIILSSINRNVIKSDGAYSQHEREGGQILRIRVHPYYIASVQAQELSIPGRLERKQGHLVLLLQLAYHLGPCFGLVGQHRVVAFKKRNN